MSNRRVLRRRKLLETVAKSNTYRIRKALYVEEINDYCLRLTDIRYQLGREHVIVESYGE